LRLLAASRQSIPAQAKQQCNLRDAIKSARLVVFVSLVCRKCWYKASPASRIVAGMVAGYFVTTVALQLNNVAKGGP